MNTRALLIGFAAPLCLTATLYSTSGVADSQTPPAPTTLRATMMDACVKAFVSTAVPKDRQIALRTESPTSSSLLPRTRPYSIVLTATTRDSGKRLATATCRTDSKGVVVALNGKPLPSQANADTKASLTAEE